ncbi:bifunctional aspartate kinase/diaminopimelate decarboxylase [Natronospira bacteriovora]|uniref:Diaminopimelate decarboxylase n=1 Tax=Natronospira bacteriovora TaxID=3069753 RepID=A0ABU0W9R5_9GAMM|nr:bifunctional aspartate kinase/diaminopimelate decarboxylase [Natronospira sp. AB-CW4]MDQ2070180.1 bifunctional aspartate kinase/diaminopimelate decarboxylase [Natronospira sp. AB-CW4]
MDPSSPLVVLKFGGTSVSSSDNWKKIESVVGQRKRDGERVLLVHSALAGVSDTIAGALDDIASVVPAEVVDSLRQRHRALAAEMGLGDVGEALDAQLDELSRLLEGARLIGEVTPRVRARAMVVGERLAGVIARARLADAGLAPEAVDPTELLAIRPRNMPAADWLSAVCDDGPDEAGRAWLAGRGNLILTQGFFARHPEGGPALLGRGGSDTSAAYLAARLGASRLEIWTDVPGLFSANPRALPTARLLKRLDYDEAQEIATTGAKILHPRCIAPVRRHGIPLQVRYTPDPAMAGTEIGPGSGDTEARVKAISSRDGVVLVSMETLGMWQEVGFLARAFECFRQHGVSVDLVSTSETNVTVSLDAGANDLGADALNALLEELSTFCRARLIENCATVSLVGRRIRSILHQLGPALEMFEERRIHLLSQAANDLNFTAVIEAGEAPRLVEQLHRSLIHTVPDDPVLGPTWQQLFDREPRPAIIPRSAHWWWQDRERLLALATESGPAFVYHLPSVQLAIDELAGLKAVDRVLYAVKANPHPRILEQVDAAGFGFECVSPGEVRQVLEHRPGIDPERILFTPNFAPREEYVFGLEAGVRVTLDNLHPLKHWPELFRGRDIFLRLDPGQGRGHHKHVRTAGSQSKFGIPLFELEEAAERVAAAGARVVGLHAHSGSGIRTAENWREVARVLGEAAEHFPEVEILDLGGGLGVVEKTGDDPLDTAAMDASLADVARAFPGKRLWLEPGRYLVARAGVLIARVTQTKGKGEARYVGIETGMNSLIRPALYGAWHDIANLSRPDEPAGTPATVVGPICETGDVLGNDRLLPECHEGDVIAIANAGAYGRVMSSQYNLRDPAAEIVIE